MELMKSEMVELKADFSKSSFESTLIKQLNQRKSSGSGFACGNEIVANLEALIEKVSEVSRKTQASPAVLALPLLDDKLVTQLPVGGGAGFTSDEEEDVLLALDEVHNARCQALHSSGGPKPAAPAIKDVANPCVAASSFAMRSCKASNGHWSSPS